MLRVLFAKKDLFLDVLGAWDFAVEDPEGLLGGPLEKRKVGVMGISMGGLAAFTAFGYEPDIPAAWIDAGVYDLQDELSFQISAALPLGPADPALALAKWLGWRFASFFAGADIGLYVLVLFLRPLDILGDGPMAKPVLSKSSRG
ncbi:hypothetical protein AK812_SmicGene5257 [Symbiodinium microadriaticum]|uniref:Uncharacterized protein n=1 Tax=Symbiodinium microadriaticum TaxID=2951 RepID=A0A1Q9EU43_SYMMI|nr:hypothetical protein AK812_SmicGene5257 [Symbiodinium microadriaticum]